MEKYSGSEDIYRKLVDDSEENWLYGLVAFAIIEEQRVEWMKHYKESHNEMPDAVKVKEWYEQQPQSTLLRAKGAAESALQVYSSDVLDIALEDQKKDVEEGMIVTEIKESRKFFPQFCVSLAGGFAGTLLFAGFLVIVAYFVFNDVSPVQIGQQLSNQTEEIENGEETRSNQ